MCAIQWQSGDEWGRREERTDKAVLIVCLLLVNMNVCFMLLFLCLSHTELTRVWAQQPTGEPCDFYSSACVTFLFPLVLKLYLHGNVFKLAFPSSFPEPWTVVLISTSVCIATCCKTVKSLWSSKSIICTEVCDLLNSEMYDENTMYPTSMRLSLNSKPQTQV